MSKGHANATWHRKYPGTRKKIHPKVSSRQNPAASIFTPGKFCLCQRTGTMIPVFVNGMTPSPKFWLTSGENASPWAKSPKVRSKSDDNQIGPGVLSFRQVNVIEGINVSNTCQVQTYGTPEIPGVQPRIGAPRLHER